MNSKTINKTNEKNKKIKDSPLSISNTENSYEFNEIS